MVFGLISSDRGVARRRSITSGGGEKVSPTRPSRPPSGNGCAFEGDDAGGILAAMLERVAIECGDGGGLGGQKMRTPASRVTCRLRDRLPPIRSDGVSQSSVGGIGRVCISSRLSFALS